MSKNEEHSQRSGRWKLWRVDSHQPGHRGVVGEPPIYSVSQKIPPCDFLTLFPKRLGIFNNFLHAYYTFQSTLGYKFLFNYLQLWRSYAILSETTHQFFTFQLNLTSKFAHWTNYVTVDVMSYPTCLLGWLANHRQRSTKLSTINDFRKRLNACVSADGGHYEHIMWTR